MSQCIFSTNMSVLKYFRCLLLFYVSYMQTMKASLNKSLVTLQSQPTLLDIPVKKQMQARGQLDAHVHLFNSTLLNKY